MNVLKKVLFLVFSSISGFVSCSLLLAVLVSIGNKTASFIVWDPGPIWDSLVYLISVLVLNIFCCLYIAKKEKDKKILRMFIIIYFASFIMFPLFIYFASIF